MVALPELLVLPEVEDYRAHYLDSLVSQGVFTFDHIKVRFHPSSFSHAFYERDDRRAKEKTTFSRARAERMPWIRATLESPDAVVLAGWIADKRIVSHDRRAVVVADDYIVIVTLGPKVDTATFLTAFPLVPNTSRRLLASPPWDRRLCRWR